jgi:hypothetical protein
MGVVHMADQEYMNEFLDAQTQAFTREDVDRAFGEEVTAWAPLGHRRQRRYPAPV